MTKLWVILHDIHYPMHDERTLNAALQFCRANKIDGLILGGDQFNNDEISHHTIGKPFYRERASYKRNTDGFVRDVLLPFERAVGAAATRIWVIGNHDDWERQLIESHPELEGIIERTELLDLDDRGWEVVPLGHAYKLGRLSVIHGEILTGVGNQAGKYPAAKAMDIYNRNVLAGHTHSPQSVSRVSPVDASERFMAWIAPACCAVNPAYLRNRPTAWVNGFTIVELRDKGLFNLYPIIVTRGEFSYGGKVYKGE